jgi:hypothetical protein
VRIAEGKVCRWAAVVALAVAWNAGVARAADITFSGNVVGQTPEIVGFNSGHFVAGSNTAAWWKYSGVNGARIFLTPTIIESSDDNGVWGDGVTSQQAFIDRRAALRADPNNLTYINWNYLTPKFGQTATHGSNTLTPNTAFGSLDSLGVDSMVQITRSPGSYPFDPAGTIEGWKDRWEHWQHFYAEAFYLAKNFDVHRFQMYNEPDLASGLTQQDFLERLELASDAVQAAVADVDALYGKTLVADMHAPVTAGGANAFYGTGWGQLVMQNLHTNYLGQQDPNFNLIQTYDYHRYSGSVSTQAGELSQIQADLAATAPGQGIRTAISEFNVSTASGLAGSPDTLDTPVRFSQMGSILSAVTNQQVNELYVFKFSQTGDASGVKKNGVGFVDNDNSPYNMGGFTKAAEVVRLYAKGFEGAQQLLQTPAASGSGATNYQTSAARNVAQRKYSILATNSATSSQTLNLNLANWNVPVGAMVTVEEVSSDRQGEVRQWSTLPASKLVSLQQPAQSVFLVSVADHAPAYRTTLGATDDALVAAGAYANTNFGGSADLFAKNDPTLADARSASFIKFDLGSIPTGSVDQAILRVSGANAGSASQVIAHVYGIANDGWNEQTITWNTAPNLLSSAAMSTATFDSISQNFITGVGTTADIVGEMTGVAGTRDLMIDVTAFVKAHPDQKLSFLIAREIRYDGENVDDALTSLRMSSKESGVDPGPQLLLSLTASALPADFNGDGVVDGSDLAVWSSHNGQANGGTKASGDADGDGDVDGADFLAWQQAQGMRLNLTGGSVASVPEPCGAVMFFSAAGVVVSVFRAMSP